MIHAVQSICSCECPCVSSSLLFLCGNACAPAFHFLINDLINLDFPADSEPSKTKCNSPKASKQNIYYELNSPIALITDSRLCAFVSHFDFIRAQWPLQVTGTGGLDFSSTDHPRLL